MKRYKLLNEVLIEWNNASEEDSDNIFLKSEDIKESLKCFIYKLNEKDRIKIFDVDWPEYKKYKDKVWINSKHVELDKGWTVDEFEPGEYKVYIKDIDKVTDMTYMFYDCEQLVSAFIPKSITEISNYAFAFCDNLTGATVGNSVTSIGHGTFRKCVNLTSVTIPVSVKQIYGCAFLGCEDLKTVYVEDINKFNQIKFNDETADPRCYGAKVIELKK